MIAPSNLTATAVSDTQINLSWKDNSAREAGFQIFMSQDSISFINLAQVGKNVVSYHATGLGATTKYYFKVRAYKSGVVSPYSNIASATTLGSVIPPSSDGIASRYPGDKNIGSDPAVIFADNFETYTDVSQLLNRWNNVIHPNHMRLAGETGNYFAGSKGLEMTLPIITQELSVELYKNVSPPLDTVYARCYFKYEPDYHVRGSNHNGICISAKYPGPGTGTPKDGTGWFLFVLQNNIESTARVGETDPGFSHLYAYWPKQRSIWGDHWYPDGYVVPYSNTIGNKGEWLAYPNQYPDFKPMPNYVPPRGQWFCYELMVHANTPGQNDGEVKWWVNGNLGGDFPNLNLRSINTLQIDRVKIELHAQHSERLNHKWHDNVVIATQYIGPMVSP